MRGNRGSTGFWLVEEYFPSFGEMRRALGPIEVHPLPIPHDCTDGFLGAYWRRPHAYLDPAVRGAISSFSRIADVEVGLVSPPRGNSCIRAHRQRTRDEASELRGKKLHSDAEASLSTPRYLMDQPRKRQLGVSLAQLLIESTSGKATSDSAKG